MYKRKKSASIRLEVLGWYGMAAVLIAYALSNFEFIQPTSIPYLALNASGSAALGWHSYVHKDSQPFILNAIWLFVALLGLFSLTQEAPPL